MANRSAPRDSANLKVINIDNNYTYDGYNSDFGPYHLEIVHKFCTEIDSLLKSNKKVLHHTGTNFRTQANAVFLMGAYLISRKN